MLDTFNESVERMRPETEKAIAEMLSGFTTFGGSVGEVISEGFEIATEVAAQWAEDNKELIGTAFDNAQKIVNDCMSGIGKVFKDVGNDIASWWRSGGASVWKGFCKIVGDLGTIALRTFNEKIMPAWKSLTSTLKKGWDGCIRPILKRASSSLTKLWKQIIQPLWDNVLKPIISQIVDKEGKRLLRFVQQAEKTCSTVFDNIKNYVTKIFDALDHLIDFVTDVFKGDWESAWKDDSESGGWKLKLDPADTINLSVGIYHYDIGLENADGDYDDIIEWNEFRVNKSASQVSTGSNGGQNDSGDEYIVIDPNS